MKPFILDWMNFPTEKCFYTTCKNGTGTFGTEDLKFNMLALYVYSTMKKDIVTCQNSAVGHMPFTICR